MSLAPQPPVLALEEECVCLTMCQILEAMYFCDATSAGPGVLAAGVLGAAVGFSGGFSGEFMLAVRAPMAARLAAEFLATEETALELDETRAVVHELANVACGATLGAGFPESSFHFLVPRPLTKEELESTWQFRFCLNPEGLDSSQISLGLRIVTAA